MHFPTSIPTASVGAAGEALVAATLLSLGLEAAKPFADSGVDLLAFSPGSFDRMVPIQVKTASSPQITLERSWFRFPGLVLVYVWLDKGTGRFFVFDGLPDAERFLGQSAATKSWLENGKWSISAPNMGPTQTARLEEFEGRWGVVADRLKAGQ